jgi:hypothetical protein
VARTAAAATSTRGPLKRSTTNAAILPTQVPSYPQPPGAYASAPPATGDVPTPDHSAPLVAQKVFFEELYKQRAVLLHAADERREASEAEARQHNAKEDAEYLQLLAEDQRRALEAQRRAEEEAAAARREEEHRQVQEGQVPSLGDAAMAPPRQVALGNA